MNKIRITLNTFLLITPLYAFAGEAYYSSEFTTSQKSKFNECNRFDSSFPDQIESLTSNGDIRLTGMHTTKTGYIFMLMSNAYGSWMEYKPLYCDLRSDKEKIADNEKVKILAKELKVQQLKEKRLAEQKAAAAQKRKDEKLKIEKEEKKQRQAMHDKKLEEKRASHQKSYNEFVASINPECVIKQIKSRTRNFKKKIVSYGINGGRYLENRKKHRLEISLTLEDQTKKRMSADCKASEKFDHVSFQ